MSNHIITIIYRPGSANVFDYVISPAQGNARRVKIKPRDKIEWVCYDADWTVFFKGETPMRTTPRGAAVASVSGKMKKADGAFVSADANDLDVFKYGVVVTPKRGAPDIDDPEIIIDSDRKKRKKPKKKKK